MRFGFKNISSKVKASFTAFAVVAGVMGGFAAQTAGAADLLDFRVNPTVFGGPAGGDACLSNITNNCFIADKIVGNYAEVITITGPNTFATEAYWDIGQFVANDGASALAGTGLNTNYALYALFSATGTFASDGAGGFDFVATGGTVSLYADTQLDGIAPPSTDGKTLPTNAPGAITVTNFANDTPLGTAVLYSGSGSSEPVPCNVAGNPSSTQCGGFALLFYPFSWTAAGQNFFAYPSPFYMAADLRGQFNTFSIPALCGPTTFGQSACSQNLNGSADAVFGNAPVPEPASLTLLGLGLFGAGAIRRRRKA